MILSDSRLSDVTGNKQASRAIIDVYDVFGFMPQTLQGADRLADSLDALVLVPDFFKGDTFPMGVQGEEEKKAAVEKFLTEQAAFPKNIEALHHVATAAKETWSTVQNWGVFGLCWGGKIAALVSGPDTRFQASGQTHPGKLEAEDAQKMSIPHICLASKDEPAEIVMQYAQILGGASKKGEVETYQTMFHGWMGGRANLEDEQNAREFERGYVHHIITYKGRIITCCRYAQTAKFFAKHL